MDDKEILAHIDDLIQTEHELRGRLAAGQLDSAQEREQLGPPRKPSTSAGTCCGSGGPAASSGRTRTRRTPAPAGEVEGYMQ